MYQHQQQIPFILLETCMVPWDVQPIPIRASGPLQGWYLGIFSCRTWEVTFSTMWNSLFPDFHVFLFFFLTFCFDEDSSNFPGKGVGRVCLVHGWWVSLFHGLRGQCEHYYSNVKPKPKHRELGLKNTLSLLVNICLPTPLFNLSNYHSSMVFIKGPHVLIRPKWDLVIKRPSYYRGGKKKEKNNDFPHLVQISQPAICFRELCNPLWLQNSLCEADEKISAQLTWKMQNASISRCWNFPDKTFWWAVTRRSRKGKSSPVSCAS